MRTVLIMNRAKAMICQPVVDLYLPLVGGYNTFISRRRRCCKNHGPEFARCCVGWGAGDDGLSSSFSISMAASTGIKMTLPAEGEELITPERPRIKFQLHRTGKNTPPLW